MSVTLDHVTRDHRWRSGHPRCLADARARHPERAARADAVGQDLDHAAAGRPRQADHRPRAGRRQGCHRRRCAAAFGGDGLSAVHQLSLADGLREYRLAAAGAAQAEGRDRKAGAGGGQASAARAVSEAHAAAAFRRPAAAHRDRARAGEGRRLVLLDEPLANLDYKLREELRAELPRIFEASGAIFVYATTEPSEALLLGGNTVCMWEGQVLQVGDTSKSIASPTPCASPQVFSDPPLNMVGDRKAQRLGAICRRLRRRPADCTPVSATAPTGSASAPISWRSPTASPAATRFRRP